MKYLLDTNVLSELARPRPEPAVIDRLERAEGDAAMSVTTWHELLVGVRRLASGRRRSAIEAVIDLVHDRYPVLPFDEPAADWFAAERVRLESSGRTMPFADGQIAAIAASRGMVLVSRNTRDFEDYDVAVENWWPSGT